MTVTQLIIWVLIAALVGIVGELLARRRAPGGMLGAIIVGFLAILLVDGIFRISIKGEPFLADTVPLFTSIIAAAILVAVWSAFAYRHVHHYYSQRRSYYRRGSYVRRPRKRFRLF